jgi:predicted transcriptional regulator
MEKTLAEKVSFLVDGGFKQLELAELLGCGQSMVSMMKTGYEPKNGRIERKVTILYEYIKRCELCK